MRCFLFVSILAVTLQLVASRPVQAQQNGCLCTAVPLFPYAGDTWVYYAERYATAPPCNGGMGEPISHLCDINDCGVAGQTCNQNDCGTCVSQGDDELPELKDILKGVPAPKNDAGRSPESSDPITDFIPAKCEGKDHRSIFVGYTEKTTLIRIKRKRNLEPIYAKIGIMTDRNGGKRTPFGVQISTPPSIPKQSVRARPATVLCRHNGLKLRVPMAGLVLAAVNNDVYLIRVDPRLDLDDFDFANVAHTTPARSGTRMAGEVPKPVPDSFASRKAEVTATAIP